MTIAFMRATIYEAVILIGVIMVFIWLLRGGDPVKSDAIIDPADSRQIGELLALAGLSMQDAAVVRFALDRFEKQKGRKATTLEIGEVVGMMKSMRL